MLARVVTAEGREEEQDGARSPSTAPFPPSWGKSHASWFYECLPLLPHRWPARRPLPSLRPSFSSQKNVASFCRSSSESFFFSLSPLRFSSGRRPARLPRESARRSFCLSSWVMSDDISNVWGRSLEYLSPFFSPDEFDRHRYLTRPLKIRALLIISRRLLTRSRVWREKSTVRDLGERIGESSPLV